MVRVMLLLIVSLSPVALFARALDEGASASGHRFWLGLTAGGAFVSEGAAVAGHAPEYLRELGADLESRVEGVVSGGFGLSQGIRFSRLWAVELNERFFWAGVDASFDMNPDLGYSMTRYVIPLSALARLTPTWGKAHLSFGVGPSMALIRTEESGSFGYTESWDMSLGVSGAVSCYFYVDEPIMLGAELVYDSIAFPAVSKLFQDGGRSSASFIVLGVRYAP